MAPRPSTRRPLAALALAAALVTVTAKVRSDEPPRRPRVGVAFAGGGARGGALVGVLEVLEELHIPVDYVAGTSIGSMVGALYATGMSPGEIGAALSTTALEDARKDDAARPDRPYRAKDEDARYSVKGELGFRGGRLVLPGGLVAGQRLGFLIRRLTLPAAGIDDFDRLPLPFRAVATDIVTGNAVVLSKGDLARAVRASMAMPGFVAPVDLDGKLLVDGGLADNLPIDVVRAMGAEVVIAIDISTPLEPRENLKDLLAITGQTSSLLTRRNVAAQIATMTGGDLLITPDLAGIDTFASADFARAVERGEAAARLALPSLRRHSVGPEEYAAFLKRQRLPRTEPRIDEVRIAPASGVDPRRMRHQVRSVPGPLDWKVLGEDVERLYQLGDFETVDFRVWRDGGSTVLTFEGGPRKLAPDRLRLGLALDTSFSAESSFGLRIGLHKTRLNRLHGELRARLEAGEVNSLSFELYQPADHRGRFFAAAGAGVGRRSLDAFSGDARVARIRTDEVSAGLDVGVSLGAVGEVRAGIVRARNTDTTETSSRPSPPTGILDVAGLRFRAVLDQLDSATFPRRGWLVDGDALLAFAAAGGEVAYDRLRARALLAQTFGETTLLASVAVDTKLRGDDRPVADQAVLGGFLHLSGLKPDQLRGPRGALAKLIATRRLARFDSLLASAVYVGASLETGNTWDGRIELSELRLAGSVFLSADTVLGPLHLALGLADGGASSVLLALGIPVR